VNLNPRQAEVKKNGALSTLKKKRSRSSGGKGMKNDGSVPYATWKGKRQPKPRQPAHGRGTIMIIGAEVGKKGERKKEPVQVAKYQSHLDS